MTVDRLGVVLVTYNSADVVLDCLETLVAAADADRVTLHIALVDNASSDDTSDLVRAWESGAQGYRAPEDLPVPHVPVAKPLTGHRIAYLSTGFNAGFAGGVNCGLRHLMQDPSLDRFWVLNPDCVVTPGTPGAFARYPAGAFSLMGGRMFYHNRPGMVQNDGGLLNRWTGVTGNANLFLAAADTVPPAPSEIDFISGGSMVVSRNFWNQTGPMCEDYFLYYEEVDWALQRGGLPLAVCPQGVVYHRAGSSIGSATLGRPASPFSLFFKNRARMMFMRRHFPAGLPVAWTYTFAKVAQYSLKGLREEARAVLAGACNGAPPRDVIDRLTPEAARAALSQKGLDVYNKSRD